MDDPEWNTQGMALHNSKNTVTITGTTITRSDIVRIVDEFNAIYADRTRPGQAVRTLEITAAEPIRDIDMLLIAYFVLFKKRFPELNIELRLQPIPGGGNNPPQERLIGQLHQYSLYAWIMTGNEQIFSFYFGANTRPESFISAGRIRAKTFVISQSFLPLIVLGHPNNASLQERHSYRFMFQERVVPPEIPDGLTGMKSSDDVAGHCDRLIVADIGLGDNKLEMLRKLIDLAFWKALKAAKIAHFYAHESLGTDTSGWRIGAFSQANITAEIYKEIKAIFDDMTDASNLHVLIYGILIESEMTAGNLNHATRSAYISQLRSLWGFTQATVRGLRELAHNVIAHSGSSQEENPAYGVITARIYSREVLAQFHGEKSFEELNFAELPTNPERFIDINIVDMGDVGVMAKLHSQLDNPASHLKGIPGLSDIYKIDKEKIEKGEVTFEHLLKPPDSPKSYNNLLEHQKLNYLTHYGLLIFSDLVSKNQGLVSATSWDFGKAGEDKRRQMYSFPKRAGSAALPAMGTAYNVFLPICRDRPYQEKIYGVSHPDTGEWSESISGLKQVLDYRECSMGECGLTPELALGDIPIVNIPLGVSQISNRSDEEEVFWTIYSDLKRIEAWLRDRKSDNEESGPAGTRQPRLILSLNLAGVEIRSASSLSRIIGFYQWLNQDSESLSNLIIINCPYVFLDELQKEASMRSKRFWGDASPVLIYAHADIDEGRRFYFVQVLYGRDEAEYQTINRLVSRNHYHLIHRNKASAKVDRLEVLKEPDNKLHLVPNLVFTPNNLLLPLDTIIQSGHQPGLTLFGCNASVLLQNEILPDKRGERVSPVEHVRGMSGFKITRAHCQLGSKLHLEDFYYVKRFFQNSFYSSRLALSLAYQYLDDERVTGSSDLTLVGYGHHSILMISLIQRLLRYLNKDLDVRHTLLANSDGGGLVEINQQNESIRDAILIIPIATTFSTAIKMEEYLTRHHHDCHVIRPIYNVIHTRDSSDVLAKEFNIRYPDDLSGRAFVTTNQGVSVEQRFLLDVTTKWNALDGCELCFIEEWDRLVEEKPILEVDRTEITPALVFTFPKGREIRRWQIDYELGVDHLNFGHLVRNNNHFRYSIKTDRFFRDNITKISGWLKSEVLPGLQKCSRPYGNWNRVVLVTPCHHSNANLIHHVNEVLFSSSATVIHYDADTDYVDNFSLFYREYLDSADNIYFIDDSLKTGRAFERMYRLVKSASSTSIDACIFLVNKAQRQTQQHIESLLDAGARQPSASSTFAFANLHLYTSLNHDQKSPLEYESDRYAALYEGSAYDALRRHFRKQVAKVRLGYAYATEEGDTKEDKDRRHLRMLKATHYLYQYFTSIEDPLGDEKFDGFVQRLYEKLELGEPSEKQKESYLKVLSQSPFSHFLLIRRATFRWVLVALTEHMTVDRLTVQKNSVEWLKKLKFLLRRACLLDSNILISFLMLERINDVIKLVGEELVFAENFVVFYVSQVKELLHRNTARCIYVEKALCKLEKTVVLEDRSPAYGQLLRMVRTENTLIIRGFYYYVSALQGFKSEDIYNGNADLAPISNFMRQNFVYNDFRYKRLSLFVDCQDQGVPSGRRSELYKSEPLLSYLWLNSFIEHDISGIYEEIPIGADLQSKTKCLVKRMLTLFPASGAKEAQEDDLGGPMAEGALFYTVAADGRPYLVYNESNINQRIISDSFDTKTLIDFMAGKLDEPDTHCRTVVELVRANGGAWENRYHPDSPYMGEMTDLNDVPTEFQHMLLMRISRAVPGSGKIGDSELPQGLLGFCFSDDRVTPEALRYLMLLREPVGCFIRKHHENSEFVLWREAEYQKQLSNLFGHGADVYLALANIDERFRQIANTHAVLQHIFYFGEKTSSDFGGKLDITSILLESFSKSSNDGQINKSYVDKIKRIAERVYKGEEVEYAVDCDISVLVHSGSLVSETGYENDEKTFTFSDGLLDVILTELIINAKKNRAISLGENSQNSLRIVFTFPEYDNKNVTDNDENQQMQLLEIPKSGYLKIQVYNTYSGSTDDLREIAKRLSVAGNHTLYSEHTSIHGLNLIKELIRCLPPEEDRQGKISFGVDTDKNGVSEFCVTIHLPPFLMGKSRPSNA